MTAQLSLFSPGQLVEKKPGTSCRDRSWKIAITHPGGWGRKMDEATETCRPTLLSLDMRCDCWIPRGEERCQCVGYQLYRGYCRGCGWYGPARTDEDPAVYDAHDHCYPGWRDLPVIVGPIPETGNSKSEKAIEAFIRRLESLGYPEGWIEAGGPIRERRQRGGTRAHTVHTGYGNYSIAGAVEGCVTMDCDGPQWCWLVSHGKRDTPCPDYTYPDDEIE